MKPTDLPTSWLCRTAPIRGDLRLAAQTLENLRWSLKRKNPQDTTNLDRCKLIAHFLDAAMAKCEALEDDFAASTNGVLPALEVEPVALGGEQSNDAGEGAR